MAIWATITSPVAARGGPKKAIDDVKVIKSMGPRDNGDQREKIVMHHNGKEEGRGGWSGGVGRVGGWGGVRDRGREGGRQ